MEQKKFLETIQAFHRRLNLAEFLKKLVFALSVGAGAGIVFQALSFVMPLYYVHVYTGMALLLAVLAAAAVSLIRRSTMEDAALVMDSFGFQERIVTAYEHLKDEGALLSLQRQDAMEQLKRHKDRIRIPLWPNWKKTALLAALFAVMIGLTLVPSPMKDWAKELHEIQQEAEEKEEEIEEVLEELEKLAEQEELSPEQLAALQEMMESLQSSMAEFQQVSSPEALQAAGEKLNYKYENMSSRMNDMAKSLQNGATLSPISAEAMQAMADRLQEMSGNPSTSNNLASNQGQNSGNQNNQSGSGQNGQGSQNNGQSGQGDGQGNGQDSQGDGQGNGQGDGQGSGQGDGQGSGQGDGQGNGQGSGQDGQGNSAAGRGTGSTNTSRDYVSIPNDIADSGNLTGNAGNHNDSEYFRDQNGLSWEGTHMSHEAVIGSYEQNAYEGIAAGRYPSGMENVIKEYFSSFR